MAKEIEVEMAPVKSAMMKKKKRMYWKRNKNSISICYSWKRREYDRYLQAYHGVPYWVCYREKEIDAVAKLLPEVKAFFENSDPGDWMTLDYDAEKKKWTPTHKIA